MTPQPIRFGIMNMEIISLPFVYFLAAALGVYHLLPRRGQNIWLLLCSLYFAASWRWEFAVILGGSILINYLIARRIAAGILHKKAWLWAGIGLNTAGLLFFRFAATGYIDLILRVLSGGTSLSTKILLPIGFSFYTLQAIAYLVEVYQKQISPEHDLVDFGLFLAYFPHLISGPIERGKNLLPQIKQNRLVGNNELAEGGWLILTGLFRKLVIAGTLVTLLPEGIFARPMEFAASDRWIAILIYGFWLYNDFAGYTGLVRGISLLFGIRLSPNFKQPFFAHNMLDFWNRWHMSLSFWLRDYIFFPIQRFLIRRGFSAGKPARIILPPLVTMLVSGIWHNATLALLAWGALHSLYQMADHLISQKPGFISPKKQPRWKQILFSLRVYCLLLPTWMLFAAGSLKLAAGFCLSLFTGGGTTRFRLLELVFPMAALMVSFFLDAFQEKHGEERTVFSFPRPVQSVVVGLGILCVVLSILWSNIPSAAFVYQGF